MNIPEDMGDHVSLDVERLIAGSVVNSSQDGGSSTRSVSDVTPAEHFIAITRTDTPEVADLVPKDDYAYKAAPPRVLEEAVRRSYPTKTHPSKQTRPPASMYCGRMLEKAPNLTLYQSQEASAGIILERTNKIDRCCMPNSSAMASKRDNRRRKTRKNTTEGGQHGRKGKLDTTLPVPTGRLARDNRSQFQNLLATLLI
ncbi:hypothetical protein R1flu_011255 [Riccia fluitans]|uniref:Uncharacterized protein n=1 Tax=Riccia fluitans TaxID=41844 RepID=A0ABD1Z8A4_9MARC